MKELRAVISDEEFATLEHLAQDLGVSLEELMKRSLAAYIAQAKAEPTFEPIGYVEAQAARREEAPISRTDGRRQGAKPGSPRAMGVIWSTR